jgi:hypothetical protein
MSVSAAALTGGGSGGNYGSPSPTAGGAGGSGIAIVRYTTGQGWSN